MANAPDSDTFINSHEKAFPGKNKTGRGQNGGANPSSIRGTVPNIASVSPPSAALPAHRGADTVGDRVKGVNVKAHASLQPRTVSDGSPGGKIPKSTNHTAKR
jgi:hypothetical protein